MNRDKVKNLKNEILQSLLVATVIAIALPGHAWAQDLNSIAGNAANNELTGFELLVAAFFYVAGGILMAAGVLKLKEHAENPSNTPIRQGISRILVGAALVALPYVAGAAVNTLGAGSNAASLGVFTTP